MKPKPGELRPLTRDGVTYECDMCAPNRHHWLMHKVCEFFDKLYFLS